MEEKGEAVAEKPPAEANGTPSKNSKSKQRRSTGGAEKSKQNRRKSQIRPTLLDAKPGDYVLAHLRSFPPWPSIVCDEEILPQSLLDTRPVTAARADGTYRDEFSDTGKRAHERTFPIMFFGTNELYCP